MKKRIFINNLGYMTGVCKRAVCLTNAGLFYLVDADRGISVYAGRLSRPLFDRSSGDNVRIADFSDFNTEGNYYIRAGYRRSRTFEISSAPYKSLRSMVMDGITASRCGHSAAAHCHMSPITSGGSERDVSGGWHEGANYSKNVVSAAETIAVLMYSLRLFGESFSEAERTLIENECRWGVDWMLKMQEAGGGVYESVYSGSASPTALPEDDDSDYFLSPVTCTATLMATAVYALSSVYFRSDSDYSAKCRKAAEHGWLYIAGTPEYRHYSSRKGMASPVGQSVNDLESRFMWALCEMYAMTGDLSYSVLICEKLTTSDFTTFGDVGSGGYAALSYLLSSRTHERDVEATIRKRLLYRADMIVFAVAGEGYASGRSISDGFSQGSSYSILCDCMLLITAYLTSGDEKYLLPATELFSYVFGKNPLGVTFMTGEEVDFCHSPCHAVSVISGRNVCGLVVGGANTDRSDNYSRWHIDSSTPPAKCYIDSAYSLSTNEPAVRYSAPAVFISAFFDKVGRSALSGTGRNR